MLNKKGGYSRAAIVVLLLGVVALSSWQSFLSPAVTSAPRDSDAPRMAGVSGTLAGGGAIDALPFETGRAARMAVSAPLRNIKPAPAPAWTTPRELAERDEPGSVARPPVTDPVVQSNFGLSPLAALAAMPAPLTNFNGNGNIDGYYPPDTNGDVGPNNYVQATNVRLQIFSKTGVPFYPTAILTNQLWQSLGGPCAARNDGDPIVLYDPMADRWNISQFTSAAPYGQCIAISTTGDPTGSYYLYFFQFSTTIFYDYPHLGVWPDGYYMGANRFTNVFQGPAAIVFDRAKMLKGDATAGYQAFNLGSSYGTLLPSDLDGSTPPPAGSPNYFASRATNALNIWKFHVDWTTAANSTFSGPTALPVAAYNQLCTSGRSCIPQPGTSVGLDGLGDRLMHRLAYRDIGGSESLVVSHAVNAASSGLQAGVRWYQIGITSTVPSILQQGTYSPDATNRWLGSVAMDSQGNMAMGYSVSSSGTYPGLRYTGRLASDPSGTMPQGETTLVAGSGSQTGTANRWGDYAMMAVDPSDDCTFWFTSEFMPTTGGASWQTRIGSFKFPGCTGGPAPTATPVPPTPVPGTPTDTPTNTPVPTATNTPMSTPTPLPQADFTLSATPTSRTVTRGSGTTYTVNLSSVNGYTGSVNLSLSTPSSKVTGTFSPNPVSLAAGIGSSTLTVKTQANTTKGTYTLTITGTDGGLTHAQTVTLSVK
ncbi:MAG: hypothetical protein M3014_01800 [Chloroflexota bacterium]|nr:hypothetical protein [Chloroflexota bacterium]